MFAKVFKITESYQMVFKITQCLKNARKWHSSLLYALSSTNNFELKIANSSRSELNSSSRCMQYQNYIQETIRRKTFLKKSVCKCYFLHKRDIFLSIDWIWKEKRLQEVNAKREITVESLNFQRKKITSQFYQNWYENEGICKTDLRYKRNRKISHLVNFSLSGNLR